jgi:hypothetical protein
MYSRPDKSRFSEEKTLFSEGKTLISEGKTTFFHFFNFSYRQSKKNCLRLKAFDFSPETKELTKKPTLRRIENGKSKKSYEESSS